MTNWVGVAIAVLALAWSGYTWFAQRKRQVEADRKAHVTASLHWLSVPARVVIAGHDDYHAGYHLVLTNRGPATARNISLKLTDSAGRNLELLDLASDELPLALLDAEGRYPIPWIYEPFTRHARRFEADVSWTDDTGPRHRTVPLRRGQLPS